MAGTSCRRAVASVVAACVGACGQGRPDALSVVPGSVAVGQGETVTFSIAGNELVVWSVREGAPNAGTIDQSGRYTAPIAPGAYHVVGFTVCAGVEMPVAYVSGTVCESALTGCNGLSKGAMAMVVDSAHELFEIVTDPWPVSGLAGWLDPAGNEIGDKCEPDGPRCVTLASGTFLLPTMYSNARHSCVVE